MGFKRITLTGYKNYTASTFDFRERIVGICGLNGKGKTNLLDAINYLCFTKSYFTKSDQLNVQFGSEGFRLEAELNGNFDAAKVVCIYRGVSKKEFYLDDIAYEKFSHHIGKFPCVMIAPDDIQMITGNSEERRKFLDTLICQLDPEYLQQLIVYNKVLQQRNSFLKNVENNRPDKDLLAALDSQLIPAGNFISDARKQYTSALVPLINHFYHLIASSEEKISIYYESQLTGKKFDMLLKDYWDKDLMTQRTNVGIHRDDILFLLNENSFKTSASQGQKKSLLFATKIAEFEMLRKAKGTPPLLLLDDIFEKLDEERIANLLKYVCEENQGQIFITDTHRERLENSLQQFRQPIQIIELR